MNDYRESRWDEAWGRAPADPPERADERGLRASPFPAALFGNAPTPGLGFAVTRLAGAEPCFAFDFASAKEELMAMINKN
jgi:hypothetical protein